MIDLSEYPYSYDIDYPSDWVRSKLLVLFKSHDVFFRNSSNNGIHVLASERLPLLEGQGDRHFNNVFFYNNKGSNWAAYWWNNLFKETTDHPSYNDILVVYQLYQTRRDFRLNENRARIREIHIVEDPSYSTNLFCDEWTSLHSICALGRIDFQVEARYDKYIPKWARRLNWERHFKEFKRNRANWGQQLIL